MMTPISIQLYSVRSECANDFFGTLKSIASYGYEGVELAGLHNKKPQEVRSVIEDLGLKISSAHGPLATPENVAEVVDIAKTMGYSMLISGFKADSFKTIDTVKAAAEKFQIAADLLRPHGLKLGYHNHWWEFDLIGGRYGFNIFFDLCEDIFSELDIYWACNFNHIDMPDFIATHSSKITMLHVKDGPLLHNEFHTAVGKGKMNIPACIKAADPAVLKWQIVELDACATDMMTAVKESCIYLKHLRQISNRQIAKPLIRECAVENS